MFSPTKYASESNGESLYVFKGMSDLVVLQRGSNSRPFVVAKTGDWSETGLEEAKELWNGSEAHRLSRCE